MDYQLIDVTADNLSQYPNAICFINPKHPCYHHKLEWLHSQFKNELKIKLLFLESEKKPIGFIEYVPGEHCWRAVHAKGYMFIHCLYTNGKKYQHKGWGRLLLEAVEAEAKNMSGVAVVTSDAAFMATRQLFLKHGYHVADESGKEQLLVKQFRKDPMPYIHDWKSQLRQIQGLHILYSRQCPWVARLMDEIPPLLEEAKLHPTVTEMKTPQEAQQAPSLYSTFNLIYNGKLLSDRYVSATRLKNIIRKEIQQ